MRPPTKLRLPIFDSKKCYNPLSPPPLLSRFISSGLFSVLQVENEVKRTPDVAEMQEAVTDELKKVQKEDFMAAFQKLYDRAKSCTPIELMLNKKKKICVFLIGLRFKKKTILKPLDRTVYVYGY
jgi:hypothetical protein